ncbi:MAG TPA: RtcB family protein [Polyangiaceae bacterium]|nr:RtcB family protein [Polyangiaceae bacterium]
MPCTINGGRVPIRLWANAHEVESDALRQLKAVASLPWVAHHVAVMPDVHVGRGATVGSVIAMRGAVAPAAVGVDIGCGMSAVRTSLRADHLPDDLRELRLAIEAAVPVGRRQHVAPIWQSSLAWRPATESLLERFRTLEPDVQNLGARLQFQLGSLGGGNHFIEVCLDTDGAVWLMLHSGSRFIGAALAEHHMGVAARLLHNRDLADPDLAVFLAGSAGFDAYRRALYWAQEYAALNRALMLERLQQLLLERWPAVTFDSPVSCHHNYVAEEQHYDEELLVTRKGAIRAGAGELGIIPGSMGARSYIVQGRGNPLSFESASHGAGRRMSRGQARQAFTAKDLAYQTKGVECRKDAGVVDEAPKAYKDIRRVMEQQQDLVEIVAELKQVVCVKG